MANYLNSDPWQEAGDLFSGASAVLGQTLLRSALLKQRRAELAQERAMDLERMKQQAQQFALTHGLAQDRLTESRNQNALAEAWRKKAWESDEATAALRREQLQQGLTEARTAAAGRSAFANIAANLGLPEATEPVAAPGATTFPALRGWDIPTDRFAGQRSARLGLANALPPGDALDAIRNLSAMESAPMSPELGAMILTGSHMGTPRLPASREDTAASFAQLLNALNNPYIDEATQQKYIAMTLDQLGERFKRTGQPGVPIAPTAELIEVTNPQGKRVRIRASDWAKAQAAGYTK